MTFEYTPSELMAVAGARELKDRQVVAVGLGLPVVASFLAKQTHAPNMTILFELGVINPQPIHTGVGLADPRVWYQAEVLSSFVDILGSILHSGRVDVGFLGGLETDKYGNLNTSLVGDPHGKFRHMVGSGGANDIASCAQRTVIIIRHEAHKLQHVCGSRRQRGRLLQTQHGGDDVADTPVRLVEIRVRDHDAASLASRAQHESTGGVVLGQPLHRREDQRVMREHKLAAEARRLVQRRIVDLE